MCGFLIQQRFSKNKSDDEQFNIALSMLKHRGPDAQKQMLIECSNSLLQIGHTRLSIIELTEQSNQPMMSVCGRYIIVFNGEIYNYLELIEILDKPIREKNRLRRHKCFS